MADVITLKWGVTEILFDARDFCELVDRYIGYDARKYAESLVEALEAAKEENAYKHGTDLPVYESQLDSNNSAFIEIQEIVERITKQLDTQPRILKTYLRKDLETIENILGNQI